MAETSNENRLFTKEIKKEVEVKKEVIDIEKEELPVEFVVPAQQECVVCVSQSSESFNIYDTHTVQTWTPLHVFLSDFTNTELPFCPEFAKNICKACLDLVNSLEHAKLEYEKLKNSFEEILCKNPLFSLPQPIPNGDLKSDYPDLRDGSEMDASSETDKEMQCLNDGEISDSTKPMDDNNCLEDDIKPETLLIPQTTVGAFETKKKKPRKFHECAVCQRQFQQKCHLRDHFRTHTGEKPFECYFCKRTFFRKDHLQKHERTHTDKPYQCLMCHRRYNQKHYLKIHMRSHTSEKLFKCDVCERRFDHKHTMKRHKATHTGEKPFDCHLCKRKFSRNYHLKRHLAVHEKEAAKSELLKTESSQVTT